MHPISDSGKNEHYTNKQMPKKTARFVGPSEAIDADEETIFEEVGHFKDRDEMLTDGNRIIQGGDATDIDDTWTYDRYDRLLGDVAQSSEPVDIQLSKVGGISDDIRDTGSHRMGTPAIPVDTRRDEFDGLTDHQLESLADSFGIPDRQGLGRDRLIRKLREYEMRGI